MEWALNAMTSIMEERRRRSETQRLRREDYVKTEAKWKYVPTSQGTSRVAGRHKKLKCGTNPASEVPEGMTPTTP